MTGPKTGGRSVVDEYRKQVESFYVWMGSRLRSIHELDFKAISTKQEQIFHRIAPKIPALISERLSLVEKGLGSVFDVLISFLTLEQQSELAFLHPRVKDWTEAALAKISECSELTPALAERVRRAAAG